MHYRLLCVGRRARDPFLDLADDYRTRLTRHTRTEIVRVRDGSLAEERERLMKLVGARDRVIALDERGDQLSTRELALWVSRWQQEGIATVTFLIGGADGLHPDLKAKAARTLALSRLTLPHRLALVLLLEQLYRAHSLLRGEPYHRD